jgi:hypothetical protein
MPNGALKSVPPFDARQPAVDAVGGAETSVRRDEGRDEYFGGRAVLLFRYVIEVTKLGETKQSCTKFLLPLLLS